MGEDGSIALPVTAYPAGTIRPVLARHDEIATHLDRWSCCEGVAPAAVTAVVGAAVRTLVRHFVAMEDDFHPAVRRCLPDGPALVEEQLDEADYLETLLEEILAVPSTDARFGPMSQLIMESVREHCAREAAISRRLDVECPPGLLREPWRAPAD